MRGIPFLLLALACSPGGRLTGRVVVMLGDSTAATVTAAGRAADVASDGSWLIDGLADGTYLVEAFAPWTLESRVTARGHVLRGFGTAEPMHLLAAGGVSGFVDPPFAQVFAAGGGSPVLAGPDGSFALELAAGPQTIVAVAEGLAPAQTDVTVRYGEVLGDVQLRLTASATGNGRLSGHAYFFDRSVHDGIAVAIDGTGQSTATAADGSYAFGAAPAGPLALSFSANGYSPVHLTLVCASCVVPDVRLELAVNRFHGRVDGDRIYPAPDGSGVLFVGFPEEDPTGAWLSWASATGTSPATRIQRLQEALPLEVVWQSDARRAAVYANTGAPTVLWAVDLVALRAVQVSPHVSTGDGGVFAVARDKLFFIDLSTGAARVGVFDFVAGTTSLLDDASTFETDGNGTIAWYARGEIHVFGQGNVRDTGAAEPSFAFEGGTLVAWGMGQLVSLAGTSPRALLDLGGPFGFSGDGTAAWAVTDAGVVTVPLAGGAPALAFAGSASLQVLPQPDGGELAVAEPGKVTLISTAGATLGSYPGAGSRFSPNGRWLVVPSGTLTLVDAATHLAHALSGTGSNTQWLFSPGEGAVALTTGCSEEVLGAGLNPLVTGQPGCAPPGIWISFDPTDRFALIQGRDWELLDLRAAVGTNLGPWVFSPWFAGDGSSVGYRDAVWPPSRVWAVKTSGGLPRHVADDDGTVFLAIPNSATWFLVEDPASSVRAPGLYTLVP